MRHEKWEERLFSLIEDSRALGFSWGLHDCCTFAADSVEAVTGTRPLLPVGYDSPRAAARVVQDLGGLQAAVSETVGQELQGPLFAQRGDLVLLRQDGPLGDRALAVCIGDIAYAPGDEGLVAISMSAPEVLGSWPIGRNP